MNDEVLDALRPFARLGGPDDGCAAAFHDLPDDVVVFENSGRAITAGDVRRARKLVSAYAQPNNPLTATRQRRGAEPGQPAIGGPSVVLSESVLRDSIIEECAKAIAKRNEQFCSDPEVCYTEHDTVATVINPRFSDHVEALDEAEAIVRALKGKP